MVQWLGLYTSIAEGLGSVPGQRIQLLVREFNSWSHEPPLGVTENE